MTKQPVPAQHLHERSRLRSLAETGLLDAEGGEALDRFTRIASRALSAPVSLVSLVDDRRQFFAAARGLEAPWKERRETPLSHSFCQHVVNERSALIVDDAAHDERVCDNLAIVDLSVASYAGFPLCDADGNVLGSFCVIDAQPRHWTEDDLTLLKLLADAVADEIELARRAHLAEKAEAALAEVNREIAAAHQRAAESNAAVMHDLRTPLQVAHVAVRSLSDHPAIRASESLSRSVGMLDRNVEQAIKLVSTGGQASVADELFQQVELAELVSDVCEELAAGTGVKVDFAVEPGEVLADPMMVRRAVQNLFSNALRFADERIRVSVGTQDGLAFIIVEDDGEGLPDPSDYDHVWDLGRRFHASRSNTGLGLAVTRQLIQALGGTVRARPSDFGGARFELWLPQA